MHEHIARNQNPRKRKKAIYNSIAVADISTENLILKVYNIESI